MKRLIFPIIFLFCFLQSYTQSSVWLIEGNGNKIYIGGSIHLLREQDYPLPAEFDQAFHKSEILVTETDIKEMNTTANFIKLQKAMMYEEGKTLKSVLKPDVYHELDSVFTRYGMNLSMLNTMKPSMAILTLTVQSLNKLGVSLKGVDQYYTEKADSAGKQFLYLETFDQQLGYIVNMGEGNEDDFVLYSIRDLDESNENFGELIEAWRAGNSKLMTDELSDIRINYPEIYKSLVLERNNNWVVQLENWMKTPETEFVIVGALHLFGTDGVLQQMKEKGYKIIQL